MLTVAEFIVWLSILLKMGPSGKRRRTKHYWCDEPGLRNEDIRSAMKRARFEQIYAQLSFMMRPLVRRPAQRANLGLFGT